MHATHAATLWLTVVAVAVAALVAVPAVTQAAAQETTAGTGGGTADAILTRYDDATTQQLQAEYDALLREEGAYLRENPTASFGADEEKANQLADARFRAVLDAPLPSGADARAEELRRKAETLYALQYWADDAGINIESEIYWGGAEDEADEYRDEAQELKAETQETEAGGAAREGAVKEETAEDAAPPGGGAGEPVEEGRPEPDAAPEAPAGEGTEVGLLAGVNPVPILALLALIGGAVFALSRGFAGGSVSRAFRPAMAEVRKRSAPKPVPKREAVPEGPEPEPQETGTGQESELEPERETERKSDPEEPSPADEDPEGLREWFERAMRADEEDDGLPEDEDPPE